MFTRAGYNLRGAVRWKIWARVSVRGGGGFGWAQIIEFASGDLAWYSAEGRFLIWGHRALVHGRLHADTWGLPQSQLCQK